MPDSIEFKIRSVANTSATREKGLMNSDPLEEDEIMFFVFPHIGNYNFWNKNVDFPLSLAFVDENGKILEFADLQKQSEKSVAPKSDEVKYVIEAKQGIFKKRGISTGDIVVYNNTNRLLVKKI